MAAHQTASMVTMYTDGSCLGNPGAGGWAAILQSGDAEKELSGGEHDTTNNRMEMMAVIRGLEAMTRPVSVDIYTDSTYVRDGITKWIHNWKRNNWKTAAKKPVKNEDLWRAMDTLMEKHDVQLHWVKGHAGHPGNERADELARSAAESL